MLFRRRLGFSGTPSDLLPKELGQCDYETGDDGKMLSTVLDSSICDSIDLEPGWGVTDFLEKIANIGCANADQRFHALIDTGALVTGYSNKEVAQQLLKHGLTWCDGVVFLDDTDSQQVLVCFHHKFQIYFFYCENFVPNNLFFNIFHNTCALHWTCCRS